MIRLFLWGHLLAAATDDDVNVLDAAFVVTDAKLNELTSFSSPVAAPEGDHLDLVRLRTPEALRRIWDEAGVWDDVARDGMPLALVDYHVDLAIGDVLRENNLYPEDVEMVVVGRNTEQLMRVMERSMPKTFARVRRQALDGAALADGFRFFLPSLLGPKTTAYLDAIDAHRASEFVDAGIKSLKLLLHRVPAPERLVAGQSAPSLQGV